MKLKPIALLAVAGALALGGCGGGKDESPAPTNAADMTPIEVANDTAATVPTEAPAAPPLDNVTTEVAPETVAPSLDADEQTQDDADATGMTARVSRDEGGNESAPAE